MSKKRIEEDSALLSVLGYGTSAPAEEEPSPKETPKPTAKKKPTQKKPSGSKTKAQAKDETRTRRVQLVLPPTLYDELNNAAWENRQSVNETIIQALTAYLKRR